VDLTNATAQVAALKEVQGKLDGNLSRSGELGDVVLNQMNQKMSEINERYLQIISRFKADSPPVLEVAREKEKFEELLQHYLTERKEMTEGALQSAQNQLQQLLSAGPMIQSIQAKIDHTKKRQQELLDQRSAIRLFAASMEKPNPEGFGNLRILDHAIVPQEQSAISRILKAGAAAIGAFLISFCLLMIIVEVWKQAAQLPSRVHRR
jgi:DNA repair exonuclease SbcCD ATPase subunit